MINSSQYFEELKHAKFVQKHWGMEKPSSSFCNAFGMIGNVFQCMRRKSCIQQPRTA
jgi:hypothetical protein